MPQKHFDVPEYLIDDLRDEMENLSADRRIATMAAIVVIGQWAEEEGWEDEKLLKTFMANLEVGRGRKAATEQS